ncbi:MAG TPA: TonB-dependent receptor [bacterium]|nr:TonB-dependent receptor [bacterium]
MKHQLTSMTNLIRSFGILGIVWLISNPLSASTISGFLTDTETADPLAYANVVLRGTDQGATSDEKGYYIIHNVAPDTYTLSISYIGYATQDTMIRVPPQSDVRVDIRLQTRSLQMDEVVVTADRVRFEKAVETSRINLSPRELEIVPAFVEADIFRSVQQLPGVVSQNDFSAALVVRGGSPDENLILLDGIEVYNPYHFGGVFSAFNTDAIRDAEFQAGGFPVRYGGRLSSVLEIRTKEGNPQGGLLGEHWPLKKYWDISGGAVDISMLSSKAFLEGPLYKGGYFISLRRTYFDQLVSLAHSLNDTIPTLPYFFYDGQWKAHTQVTDRHRVDVQGYFGADDLTLQFGAGDEQTGSIDFNWIWGNRTNSAIVRSILRSDMMLESMVAMSAYDFDVDFTQTTTDSLGNRVANRFLIKNVLEDVSVAERLDWKLSSAHRLQTGLSYKRFRFRFTFDNDETRFLDEDQNPRLFSAYIQDTWQMNIRLNLQAGVRGSYYSLSDKPWFDLRGGFKYRIYENTALKGSAGLYTQFLFTSNDDDAILRVVDFWNPVPDYLDPQRAIHYILGVEQWIGAGHQLSLEAYYKPYLNVLDLNPIQNVYNDRDDYVAGTGFAWGIETILKRSVGNVTGWIAYTYARTVKRIDLDGDGTVEPEQGEVYAPKYDKRHNFNLVLNYRINEKHSLGISWNWSSGQPYTPVVGKQYGGSETSGWFQPYLFQSNIQGNRNSARFPNYLRGDVSYTRYVTWFGLRGSLTLQVINFTNHFNVLFYQWNHSASPSAVTAYSMFPIIPTMGISFQF